MYLRSSKMTHLVSIGAINKETQEYVYPLIATKKDHYICPECNHDVVICQGKIRAHHFRHKRHDNPCQHYNHPSESQIHKDAKLVMKHLLETNVKIRMIRTCSVCEDTEVINVPQRTDASSIHVEYRFEYDGDKIADVAFLENNQLAYIFEICNTHKTKSDDRPEPWFEIDAEELIQSVTSDCSRVEIPCIREIKCEECLKKKKQKRRTVTYGIRPSRFMYVDVVFENKLHIKSLGAKWNNEHKLWYIPHSDYEKNKAYVHKIGQPVKWKWSDCAECGGTCYDDYDKNDPCQVCSWMYESEYKPRKTKKSNYF